MYVWQMHLILENYYNNITMDITKVSLPIFMLSLLTFVSCATSQSVSADTRTRTFNADYNKTFQAVAQTLSNEGYTLDFSDPKSGVINTDYQAGSAFKSLLSNNEEISVDAILNKKNNGTQVKLRIDVENIGPSTGGKSDDMTKTQVINYYKNLFMKIEDNL